MQKSKIFALSLIGALLVVACGGTASPVGDSTYKPGEGKVGGTLVFGDWQEALTFNPAYISQVTEANVMTAVFAGLVSVTADLKYVPDMAATVPTVENKLAQAPGVDGDAMTVTWNLRPDLKWSDGVAITCDDFAFSRNWVLSLDAKGEKIPAVDAAGKPLVDEKTGEALFVEQPLSTLGVEEISSIECVSATEMVFHYSEVFEGYITGISVYPKHYFEKFPMAEMINGAGFRNEDLANVPVSGPFKFVSATPAVELRLARNENYTSALTGKSAKLDELVFKWYASAEAMVAGFRAGEVDLVTDLLDSDLPAVADLGEYETGGQVSAIDSLQYEFLRPNHSAQTCSKNPAVADRGTGCPASDPAVRKAIAQAVDKAEINERLLGNNASIAASNISPLAYYFKQQQALDFDVEAAKATLEAAGWKAGTDGVREKGGLKLKIELCTTTRQIRLDALALIAATLKEAGFETVISGTDASTQIFAYYTEATPETPCNLAHGNFDVAMHAYSSSVDPLGNYATYHSSQFQPTGGNDAQVAIKEIDDALDAVKSTIDFAEINKAMATFQKIYVDQVIEIPLYYRKAVELVAPSVGNFVANPTVAGPLWNAVDLYLK